MKRSTHWTITIETRTNLSRGRWARVAVPLSTLKSARCRPVQETLPCPAYMDDLAILLEADSYLEAAREAGSGHRGHVPHCVGFWPPAQLGAWPDGGGGELGWPGSRGDLCIGR